MSRATSKKGVKKKTPKSAKTRKKSRKNKKSTSPRKKPSPSSERTPTSSKSERATLDNVGRIVVPAKFRKELGLKPGDPVTVSLEGNVLRIQSIRAAIEDAQALMRKKNPNRKRSAVDELIAERRAEAAKE